MKDAGYATGLVGKWHCGRGDGYHPLDRGFDEFEGFDGSEDVGYFDYRFVEQRQVVKFTDRYLTEDLSDRAIQFVRRHQKECFFLHLAHYAPHRPLEAPAEMIQRYRDHGIDEATATIYAMIEVMDRGVGELLDEIERLGLSENTIVLFASDNGPDPLTGDRANQGLRGAKYQVYEGGIRVPLFIRWESQLSPGERTQTVSFVDLMPTILQLCGIEHGITPRMDGQSFVDVLRDENAVFAPPRFWQWNRVTPNYSQNAAMREGRFKLVRPFVTRGKNVADSKLPSVLFDLQSDPTESTDVSARFPKRAERMDQALQRWADLVERDRVRAKDLGAGR